MVEQNLRNTFFRVITLNQYVLQLQCPFYIYLRQEYIHAIVHSMRLLFCQNQHVRLMHLQIMGGNLAHLQMT